jgi:phage I-like protein
MTTIHFAALTSLAADSIVAADGTIWSHAATIGTRFKGTEFTIDKAAIENFKRVFETGYPQKVPVDYEHASTSADPEIRRLRAEGKAPKAGDVLELRGVYAVSDFTGELRAAAEKLAQKAQRPLEDPKNLGLWMRWKPTRRALGMIQDGEYTELSIAFDEDLADNLTGKGQGPGLVAVALLNLPFLDDMLPVAASRDLGGSPAAPGQERITMSKTTMLAAAAALFGKPVSDEDQAVVELTALQSELPRLREFSGAVGKELGESDPAKAVAKVRELTAAVARHEQAAKDAQATAIKTTVEATLKEHESKYVPAMRPMLERELTRELTEGKVAKDTDVVKALSAAPATGITGRSSGTDLGGDATGNMDERLDREAKSLLATDPELKELAKTDYSRALDRAQDMAAKKIGYTSEQMERVKQS